MKRGALGLNMEFESLCRTQVIFRIKGFFDEFQLVALINEQEGGCAGAIGETLDEDG